MGHFLRRAGARHRRDAIRHSSISPLLHPLSREGVARSPLVAAIPALPRTAPIVARLDHLLQQGVRHEARPTVLHGSIGRRSGGFRDGAALLYLVQAAEPPPVCGSTIFFLTSRGGRTAVPGYAAIGDAPAMPEGTARRRVRGPLYAARCLAARPGTL